MWRMAATVGAVAVLLAICPASVLAAFPGANGQIAFWNTRAGGIWAMDPNGTGRHRVTMHPSDTDPAYSPSGVRLAFTCQKRGLPGICVARADGAHRKRLTGRHLWGVEPAFSADGKRIVFSGNRGHGYSDIWVMHVDGTHRHKLIHTCGNDWEASYSPNGGQILFTRVHCSYDASVAVMNGNGSDLHDLTTRPGDDEAGWADYSPDGSKIVYARDRGYRLGIWLMNSDGSDQHELTPPATSEAAFPAFSPNGHKVVFANGDRRRGGIYVMKSDGGDLHRVPRGFADGTRPTWGVAG